MGAFVRVVAFERWSGVAGEPEARRTPQCMADSIDLCGFLFVDEML